MRTTDRLRALFDACPAVKSHIARSAATSIQKLFFIEAAGIWIFALYWAAKSYELSLSGMEKDTCKAAEEVEAAVGKVETKPA